MAISDVLRLVAREVIWLPVSNMQRDSFSFLRGVFSPSASCSVAEQRQGKSHFKPLIYLGICFKFISFAFISNYTCVFDFRAWAARTNVFRNVNLLNWNSVLAGLLWKPVLHHYHVSQLIWVQHELLTSCYSSAVHSSSLYKFQIAGNLDSWLLKRVQCVDILANQ